MKQETFELGELLSEEIGESDIKPAAVSHYLPKSLEFSARDITSDFHASCRQLRILEPKGWHGIIAGSIRRGLERVHDLDVVFVIDIPEIREKVRDFFAKKVVPWHADYRFCEPGNKGAMLLYLTGDKDSNIKMRWIAAQKGLMLNEYGLWGRKHNSLDNRLLVADSEEGIYHRLGLEYLRPSERSFRVSRQEKLL